MIGGPLAGILLFALTLAAAVLLMIFVLVPLFRGIGWLIAGLFKGIGFLVVHIFEFVAGMLGDALRFVGSLLAMVLLAPLVMLNVVIGRWSAAGHFADSVKRECGVGVACLYRVLLRRPLKLVFLHGLLEGVEQRVPEAMAAAPTADMPRRHLGQFPGYTIVGSLRGGGSGAKLYIARPDDEQRLRHPELPERVVIKAFALSEGSSLPQMLRESRALECAKQLGLVFDHGMDERRFYYVMQYFPGDNLGIVTRQLHGAADPAGLAPSQLATVLEYMDDLVSTLSTYHRGGLWHKDVKPENIIIHEGRARLVDLGLVTPLRSAMTLTTHGTEYFRDPEFVRQALRGVKVHQVNGAKFDVYAAGALLYFLIENTFPPHGALSRFSKRSPDALRWIIRRAMADYTHRYESADAMLADLRSVHSARDFFAVRPADLPSMHGVAAAAPAPEAEMPPPIPPASSPAAPAPVFAAATPRQRPTLEVSDWWTGTYRVADAGAAIAPSAPREADAAPASPPAMFMPSAAQRAAAGRGARNVRRAAREQVASARTRAADIRKRARRHRARSVGERQPTAWVAAIVLVVLVTIPVIGYSLVGRAEEKAITAHARAAAVADTETIAFQAMLSPDDLQDGLPILMVRDARDESPRTQARVDEIVAEYRAKGFDVIVNDEIAERDVRGPLQRWQDEQDRESDGILEAVLARYNLYGFLQVEESRAGTIEPRLIWSTEHGARERRWAAPPAMHLPYLLVNDHPTRHDPAVASTIDRFVEQYAMRGWEVMVDDVLEAEVRSTLPPGPIESGAAIPKRLRAVLGDAGLAGLLYVHARPGDGPARDRIRASMIEAAPLPPATAEVEITVSPGADDPKPS